MHQGHTPLALIHFGDPLWRAHSPACWKMECCMWPVKEVEIHFAKISFVDCKWSNLNVLGSYTSSSPSLWGSIMECSLPCMVENGMLQVAC